MDYIETLLRRQQAALCALMLGGETAAEKGRTPDPDREIAAGHQRGQPKPEETVFRRRYPSGIPEETFVDMGRQSVGGMSLEDSPAALAEEKQEEPPAKRGAAVRESGVSHRKTGSAASAVWEEEPLKSLGGTAVGWVSPALPVAEERENGNVQKVSRAIQLDARRYDGGFTIY